MSRRRTSAFPTQVELNLAAMLDMAQRLPRRGKLKSLSFVELPLAVR